MHPRQTEYPGQDPLALLLDVGATVHCEADELVHVRAHGQRVRPAHLEGAEPARRAAQHGDARTPRAEPALVEANRRLRAQPMIDFVGNVEGNDLVRGRADVIVCEGYVGNVALKLLEGVSEVLIDVAQAAAERKLVWRVGLRLLSQGIERVHALTDFSRYGGSPILGFDRLFIKCHGRSRARAVANAVKVAAKAVRDRVPAEIARRDRRRCAEPASADDARADAGAAAALPLGPRQDLPAQRVRHPAPAVAHRARARRGQDRGAGRHRAAEGAARRRRPARPTVGIYFISASPPQIGQAIRDKLRLDGVPYDGIVFKDQLQLLRRGKFGKLREHVGFKLGELLPRPRASAPPARASCSSATTGSRTRSPTRSTPTSSTGTLALDRARAAAARAIGVDPEVVPEVRAPGRDGRRARRRRAHLHQPRAAHAAGVLRAASVARLVPTFNYFQTALVLAADGWLDADDVAGVGARAGRRAPGTRRVGSRTRSPIWCGAG